MRTNWCLAACAVLAMACGSTAPVSPTADIETDKVGYRAFGRITDFQGNGLEGVEVHANTGSGTLMRGGSTVSDADGNYTLDFKPGYYVIDDGTDSWKYDVRCAVIYPVLPGFSEVNDHRHGNLLMAFQVPEDGRLSERQLSILVVYGEPHRVDFVMKPTAD